MSALSINPPYPVFPDIDGQPLEDGYIWIGTAGLNPISNPIVVYWDAALTIPAPQPIRTIGGFPARAGTPAILYANSDYSIQVQNKNGSVVYSSANATELLSSDLVTFIQAGAGAVQRTAQSKMREIVSVKDFGAVGDNVTDDTNAINAAIASVSSGGSVFVPRGVYVISDTIRIPSRVHFYGEGEISQLEWGGAVPAVGSKKPMVAVSHPTDPTNNAVANAVVSDIHLDCRDTANLVGIEFVYASFQSQGQNIRVSDVGANGAGFRFCREWYASFDTLSVRCATKNSGSIGFWFDTAQLPVGEINGVPFRNLQTNKCSIGILIDTTSYLYACTIDQATLEQGDVGIRHIGKKGVRQMQFTGVYLESNTVDVDWKKDGAATDTSGIVLWNNIQCQFGNSVWTIAEGNHQLTGVEYITNLTNSGALLQGNAVVVTGSTSTTGTGKTLILSRPTYLPQGTSYASILARPQATRTVRNVVQAATTTITVALPADLLNTAFPTYGREIKLSVFCRKWSNTQNRYWEGYLVQRDNQTWALFRNSYSSAIDATWDVTVDATTGELTIFYSDTAEGKIITTQFSPM